jgi:hypothetical protein
VRLPRTFLPDSTLPPYNHELADGQKILWKLNSNDMVFNIIVVLLSSDCSARALCGTQAVHRYARHCHKHAADLCQQCRAQWL